MWGWKDSQQILLWYCSITFNSSMHVLWTEWNTYSAMEKWLMPVNKYICILCKSLTIICLCYVRWTEVDTWYCQVFGNWHNSCLYLWQCIHDTVTKQIWSIWSVKRTSSFPSRSASDATTCSSSFFPVTLMIFCLVFQYFCWNLFTTDESWLSIKRSKYSRE